MVAHVPVPKALATMMTSVLASPARNMPRQLRETGGLGGICPWLSAPESTWVLGRTGSYMEEAAAVSTPQVILKS